MRSTAQVSCAALPVDLHGPLTGPVPGLEQYRVPTGFGYADSTAVAMDCAAIKGSAMRLDSVDSNRRPLGIRLSNELVWRVLRRVEKFEKVVL